MNACPSPQQLQELLDGQLSAKEYSLIEGHVERCQTCQAALNRLTVAAREGLFHPVLDDSNLPPRTNVASQPPIHPQSFGKDRGSERMSDRPRATVKVGLTPGSRPHLTGEIQTLLRLRLRLAGLIVLCGFTLFLVNNLWTKAITINEDFKEIVLYLLVVVTLAVLTGLLWSRWPLTTLTLRVIEVLGLGSVASFFAHYQWDLLYVRDPSQWSMTFNDYDVASCIVDSCTLRWVILLILYGVYVPNTWRRCIAVVAVLACCPLSLTVAVAVLANTCDRLGFVLPEMGIWLGVAAILAVYSTHKISELRQAAFEARKLGQYRLKECLGKGGMGEVYLAEHQFLRRPCAIKLIRPEKAGDPRTLRRFEREVQAMASLTHGNTVEIFDFGHSEDGTFYYVMEYLPGQNLQELVIEHGWLAPGRAVHFLRQVCSALQEAHAAGLIHRDIKPSNIIVCERGGIPDVVKLLDFGLVRAIAEECQTEELTQEGVLTGTPAYLSPEQATGKSALDARSDIYSLGAVAYFLLTGQPPFVRENALQQVYAHVHEPVIPLTVLRPELPTGLQAVVLQCLEKDPNKRFADAKTLEQALHQCCSKE